MMKRFLWILITLIGLYGVFFIYNTQKPDGLEFIRDYKPDRENRYAVKSFAQPYGRFTSYNWRIEFLFREIPPALTKHLQNYNRNARRDGSFEFYTREKVWGSCEPEKSRIVIFSAEEPSGLAMTVMNLTNSVPERIMESP